VRWLAAPGIVAAEIASGWQPDPSVDSSSAARWRLFLQSYCIGTVRKRKSLDGLVPEPLADVLEREAEQRVRVAELLDGLDERATLRTWARLVTRRTQSR
jgi:hypothetical protein